MEDVKEITGTALRSIDILASPDLTFKDGKLASTVIDLLSSDKKDSVDTILNGLRKDILENMPCQSINTLPGYRGESPDEIRLRDYVLRDKEKSLNNPPQPDFPIGGFGFTTTF